MIRFLSILLLTFTLQSLSNADEIKDFEIEGFLLGQSLLDHFDKIKIEEEINSKYSIRYNDQFIQIGVGYGDDYPLSKKIINYDEITLILKANDTDYEIYSIGGKIFCESIESCLLKKKEITTDLKNFFGDKVTLDSYKKKHQDDKSGKSFTHDTEFIFGNEKDHLAVSYYQWSKEANARDNVKVIIHDEVFYKYLSNYY